MPFHVMNDAALGGGGGVCPRRYLLAVVGFELNPSAHGTSLLELSAVLT